MEKELFKSFIGKTLNIPADEVSSLLYNTEADVEVLKADALTLLLEKDKNRVQNFANENKNHYDKGYNKAKAEVLSDFEKQVRDKFSFTEDKKGVELIDAIIATKVTGSELEEEKVKRSKTYLDTIDALKRENQRIAQEAENKFTAREKQLQKEAAFKSISEKALTFVQSLNPVLPTDPTKAKNQLQTLIDKLSLFEYDVKEDGKIVVLKKQGEEFKVLVDEHQHPVSFEDMVKQHANTFWDFKEGEQRSGAGNKNDDAGSNSAKGYTGKVPANDNEYMELITKAEGNEELQIQITKAYKSVGK